MGELHLIHLLRTAGRISPKQTRSTYVFVDVWPPDQAATWAYAVILTLLWICLFKAPTPGKGDIYPSTVFQIDNQPPVVILTWLKDLNTSNAFVYVSSH